MRIKTTVENISYDETQMFFNKRAEKYNNENPYSVTMYQDQNPELVKQRNEAETHKLLPKLQLTESSKVLDVACGIGRWSDAIQEDIDEYCGLDFCESLIKLAQERNMDRSNRKFYVSRNEEVAQVLKQNGEGEFNRVLLIGALVYLNDEDVIKTLNAIESICQKNTIICVREPIGIKERLTLKDNYSEELNDNYNAIYRSVDELKEMFQCCLVSKGFNLVEEAYLFEDPGLNNRVETSQYYFIFER